MLHLPLFVQKGDTTVETLADLYHGLKDELAKGLEFRTNRPNQRLGLFLRIGVPSYLDSAKHVNSCSVKGLENVPNLVTLLAVLFPSGEAEFPLVLGLFLEKVLDPQLFVVDGIQVALVSVALHVADVNTHSENVGQLLAVRFGGVLDGRLDVVGIRQTAAGHKAGIGGSLPASLGEPLKVVGIVNGP